MGSKRSQDPAAMLASSASVAQHIMTLPEASTSKVQILNNMERNQFSNSSPMQDPPEGRDFRARTAARMISEMAAEDKLDSEGRAGDAAAREQQNGEARRLQEVADAEAQADTQRTAARAALLAARAAAAADRVAAYSTGDSPREVRGGCAVSTAAAASRGGVGRCGGVDRRRHASLPPPPMDKASTSCAFV